MNILCNNMQLIVYICGISEGKTLTDDKQTRFKMEKEELLSKLNPVIGNPDSTGNYGELGISTRTLDAYVDAILPTLGESVTDEQINSHITILKAMGGQLRHEKAEFAKNYKPTIVPKNKEPKEPKNVEDGNGNEVLEMLNKIISDNKALKTRLDEKDNEEKQKALRARVVSGMKEKNATDDYVLKNCLKGVVFDDKKSVDDLVNECLSLYDAQYKEARGVGSNPRNGGNGGGSKDGDIDAFFSEMKKRGKF